MSKTDGRRFCQPIPLSSILDPTYRSPFSKLQQFQVDMDISSPKMYHQQHQQPRPCVWRKLQSTLMSAMSNLVVISHPVFSTPMMSRSSSCMTLVPWKSWKTCDSLVPESEADFSKTTEKTVPGTPSLYYSIRSGLEYLRYFATHPLSYEESIRQQKLQNSFNCDSQQDHCKQTNIVPQPDGLSIISGTLFFPFLSDSCTAFSAPTTPSHHRTAQFPIPNLFSLAMSGLLISSPQHPDRLNSFYKNCYIFSPMQGQRSMSTPSSPQKSRSLITPTLSPTTEAEIEIFIHSEMSVSTSQNPFCPKLSNSASPTPSAHSAAEVPKTMSSEASCIRIETNWIPKNGMSQDESSLTNFHTMSVCAPSSPSKGGTVTFSCSSMLSSSPKAMPCNGRRRKTESESSTDSFIEFSASVESSDSFCIVFEPAGSCIDEETVSRDEEDDDDDDWEDEDSDEDDSDDGEDQVFNYSSSGTDDLFMDGVIFQADGIDCSDQVDFCFKPELVKKKKLKNVSFNEEQLENVIEFEDDVDSKSSRETYWEMLARDRARFQDRIFRTGDILEPILEPTHRSKVFQQRFCSEN